MKAGWRKTAIGDVCELMSGSGFPVDRQGERQGAYPFFKVSDMNLAGNERAMLSANNYVSEDVRVHLGAKVIRPDSVIFPKVGGAIATNKKRRIVQASCIDNNVMALTPKPDLIDSDYLAHWLDGFDIYEFSNKANPPSITQSTVSGWPLILPPLEEQRRIVAVLDEAFEGLARASANAEANLQNARELYSLTAQEILARHTDGNKLVKLRAVAEFRNGLNFSQSSSGQVVKVVGVGDFQDNFWVPQSSLKTVQIEGELDPVDQLQAGDLLAVRSNGNRELIGRIMLAGPTGQHVAHSGFTIRIRSTSDQLVPEYLCHFLKSGAIREKLVSGGGGANISNLNQGLLGDLDIRVPSPAIQKRMIRDLDDLAGRFERLREMYTEKQSGLCCLRQSVLQKAFAGELT